MTSARSIGRSFGAAVRDLRRERDRVWREIWKSEGARRRRDERRSRFEEARARQQELCAGLRSALADLRDQREKRWVEGAPKPNLG